MNTPTRKSRTQRRTLVADARRSSARYQNMMDPKSWDVDAHDLDRVNALLWAIAKLNRALALETGGSMGDQHSTPRRIAEQGGRWTHLIGAPAAPRTATIPILEPVLEEANHG